ncbi:helix-turn-helix transcriptional regulator [Streptomyces sp. NPDC004549]|uniref:helix-turn-helix domain-containing protein n=1 Tax=Streptomyces sp. NPDC004549 TaxID=3154283 RepID=UPI0033B09782
MVAEPKQFPDSVWATPRMHAAFAQQPPDFGAVIEELQNCGISQQRIASLTGLHQSTLSRLARGEQRLSDYEKIVGFLQGLGVPPELSPLATPGTRQLPAPDPQVWESPATIAADLTRIMASNTTVEAINLLEFALREVLAAYEADGPTGPLGLAGTTGDLRRSLIDLARGHHPASVRIRLFRLLAQVSAVLGYMAVNAGQHARADAYCYEAITLAADIADTDTLVWAHGTRSFNAYYQGDYQAAITHAHTGIALAPHHPQAVRLYANGLSRAQAKLGNPEALDSVYEALRLTDQHDLSPGLTPCISLAPYGRARTLANALTAHVALGDGAGALRHEPYVAHAIRDEDSWSRSLVRLDVATAQLACDPPEIEHAMILGEQVITDHEHTPLIVSIHQRCHELYQRACQSWACHPAVQGYGQALHHLDHTPTASAFQRTGAVPLAPQPPRTNGALGSRAAQSPRPVADAGATMTSPT